MSAEQTFRVDCLQYANWSETIFRQMREGGLDAVHVNMLITRRFVRPCSISNAGTDGSNSILI